MKIIAIVDNNIKSGGGFNQALNAILQMQSLCKDHFEFEVLTSKKENLKVFLDIGIMGEYYKYSIFDSLISKISQNIFWITLQTRLKWLSPLEKKLIACGCDLVYFPTPGGICGALQKLNYILTIWDLSHRDTPEFPEVRDFGSFALRENNFKNYLAQALVVITDSDELSRLASSRYGIDPDRFIAIPFSPSPTLKSDISRSAENILEKYHLAPNYFYYPAQFWAHKNHIRIIEALAILKQNSDWCPQVIFTGQDYGNLAYLKRAVQEKQLTNQVSFLGFVPMEDIRGLYEGAHAVLMPTYFGQTNLPPLEAWSLGRPLIYSDLFRNQAHDAAILVNPDSASDIAKAMLKTLDTNICDELIKAGASRLDQVNLEREVAAQLLYKKLSIFSLRRKCWP